MEVYIDPANKPPDNNLVWAIVSTILCCWPLGIVAIIKATKVNTLWAQGDHTGAQKSADEAKKWAIYSAVGAVVFSVIGIIMAIVFGLLSNGF
tara:strand:+ start:558 stop:836 length:279 start_codon:yes stop_codon:yes gene_type:complete